MADKPTAECIEFLRTGRKVAQSNPRTTQRQLDLFDAMIAQLLAAQEMAKALDQAKNVIERHEDEFEDYTGEDGTVYTIALQVIEKALTAWREAGWE